MKEVYQVITDKIKASVAAIRFTDFDLGQLDKENPPVSFPCVLMNFDNGDYEKTGQKTKNGTLTVMLRVAFRLHERTHSIAEESYRNEALEFFDTLEALDFALDDLSGTTFSGLTQTKFKQENRADLRIWQLYYECQHFPAPPPPVYVDWPNPGNPPNFCIHPDVV